MKKAGFFFGSLILFSTSLAYALLSTEAAQFEKANLAYRANKFDEAAALYKALVEKHPGEASFQFNYGNVLYRRGEVGNSILAFERAHLAAPRNADILYNLKFMRAQLEYRIEDRRNELIKLGEKLLGYFTFVELFSLALASSLALFASWALALFFSSEVSWGGIRKLILWISLWAFVMLGAKSVQMEFFREAIVTTKEAQVYYGPSVNDQAAFRLGEGLKVYVVDSRDGWSRILIASGESGWIQNDSMAEIAPRKS